MNTILRSSAAMIVMSLTACSPPMPETFIPKIQQEGQAFLNAISSENEAVAARMMPSGYRKLIDGEVAAYLRKRTNGFRENSFAITGASVGIPQVPQSVDGMLISFVPATSQAEYDDGGSIGQTRFFGPTSITIPTYLAAVSSDKGRTWTPSPYAYVDCGRDDCTGSPQGTRTAKMGQVVNGVRCYYDCKKLGKCCEVCTTKWKGMPDCEWRPRPVSQNSPLIVDIFNMGEPDLLVPGAWKKDRYSSGHFNTVRWFNLDGIRGAREKAWEWVGPKAGLLVYGESIPTLVDGTNLFGNVSFGKAWAHGYEPLATLDINKDGKLDGRELNVLWIWLDADSDAKVQRGEIQAASKYLTEIPLAYESDAAGNTWQNPSILLKDGRAVRSWDWWSRNAENVDTIDGTIYQAAGLSGGTPPDSLCVYFWGLPSDGETANGLLRFIPVGSDVYVISVLKAAPGSDTVGHMLYAKVEKKDGEYVWNFLSYLTQVDDKNRAQVDGDYLIGTGVFTNMVQLEPSSYEWQAELVGDPLSTLRVATLPLYELLTSFSDADFGRAIATFPVEGGVFVVDPAGMKGLRPAEVLLESLFQTGTEPASPIAVYQANESTEDSSGQGWNASNPEEAEFADGLEGSAFNFLRPEAQGIKTEMDVSADVHPSMTWSAWVLPNQVTERNTILSGDKGNFGRTLVIENGRFAAFTGYNLFVPDAEAELGKWAHIVVVFAPDQIRLYKNGQEFTSGTPPRYTMDFNPLEIGRNPGFGQPFRGLIDEVEIFDSALSSTQIEGLYNKLRARAEAISPLPDLAQEQE